MYAFMCKLKQKKSTGRLSRIQMSKSMIYLTSLLRHSYIFHNRKINYFLTNGNL